jgi:hypothetical protein
MLKFLLDRIPAQGAVDQCGATDTPCCLGCG